MAAVLKLGRPKFADWTLTGQIDDTVSMVDKASKDLFGKILAPYHCLRRLLSPQTENIHDLGNREHNYLLSQCIFNLYRNFLSYMSFSVCIASLLL